MEKVWFISDTHFGHENIIDYCNRPFKNVDEMNNKIIDNWNNVIKSNDLVFHLGDFAFKNTSLFKSIMKSLSGRKVLIRGNHDRESNEFYRNCGFENVSYYPILYADFFILSHFPIYKNLGDFKNICGHVHEKEMKNKSYFNVSVERINYTPVNFETIKKYYNIKGE